VIEAAPDTFFLSFHEPAEFLATIAVKVTIRVDQMTLGASLHHGPLRTVPVASIASSPTAPELRFAVDNVFSPRHDASRGCLGLRYVEVATENGQPIQVLGHNG